MVKLDSNFKSRTATPDSLKISSPKVRDDPFGSSSPQIAFDCPRQSNFRGSTPDSPVILSLKSCDKPYGSFFYRVASDVPDRASIQPISWLFLQYEPMLICSFLPRQSESCFASCSWRIYSDMVCRFLLTMDIDSEIFFVHFGDICHGDDITAFWPSLEHRYAYRKGELILSNPKQNHGCGDVGVMLVVIPPAFCCIAETASSLDMTSVDLSRELYVIQELQIQPEDSLSQTILQLFSAHILHVVRSSTRILLQHIVVLQPPDIQVLLGSVGYKHVCTFKELNLKCIHNSGGFLSNTSRYHQSVGKFFSLKVSRSSIDFADNQLKHSMFASHASHMFATSHNLQCFKIDPSYISDHWISKKQENVHRKSEEAECTSLDGVDCEFDWFSYLLLDLHIELVDYVVLFSGNQAALVYHQLLWQHHFPSVSQQGLSQDFAFIDHMIVASSVWSKSILDLLYCSLPRPPEVPCDFC